MKVIVSYSGGKDSQAALIHTVQRFGAKNVTAVFCDTGWEHELTIEHINQTTDALGVQLDVIRSKKYNGMVDLAQRKKRFPSTKARFCTEELKSKPMIDYVLEQTDNLLIVQGIRKDESHARKQMSEQCRYFKHYILPYRHNTKGAPVFHTYRKKDVLQWIARFSDDIHRPCFLWSAQQTIDYILSNGQKPNPLYYKGFHRVGCMPCVMARHQEVKSMLSFFPEYADRLKDAEAAVGSTFFPPDYIPTHTLSVRSRKGHLIARSEDVYQYLSDDPAQHRLFEEPKTDGRCMSFYGICE